MGPNGLFFAFVLSYFGPGGTFRLGDAFNARSGETMARGDRDLRAGLPRAQIWEQYAFRLSLSGPGPGKKARLQSRSSNKDY